MLPHGRVLLCSLLLFAATTTHFTVLAATNQQRLVLCNTVVIVNESNATYVFADRVCDEASSTAFIITFVRSSNATNAFLPLENVFVAIHNVIGGLFSVIVADTGNTLNPLMVSEETQRPTIRNFTLELINVTIFVRNATAVAALYNSVPGAEFLGIPQNNNAWTLVRFPWPKNSTTSTPIGLVDNLNVFMVSVNIFTNTSSSIEPETGNQIENVPPPFLESLIILQPTFLQQVNVSMVNCIIEANTSSSMLVFVGRVNIQNLWLHLLRVNMSATCATAGCVPILIMFGGAPKRSAMDANLTDVGLERITTVLEFTSIQWNVIPSSGASSFMFPTRGTAYNVNTGFCGVITVTMYQTTSYDTVLIDHLAVFVRSSSIVFWVEGASPQAEEDAGFSGFDVGVVSISGHDHQPNHKLSNVVVNVSSCNDIAIRSSSSTVLRTNSLKGGITHAVIVVDNIASCRLYSLVPKSSTANSVFATIVHVGNYCGLRGDSNVSVSRILLSDHKVQSGELLNSRIVNGSIPIAILASVITLSATVMDSAITVDEVTMTVSIGNGTLAPIAQDGLPLISFTCTPVTIGLIVASAALLEEHVQIVTASSLVRLTHFQTKLAVAAAIFPPTTGALTISVSAMFLGNCPRGVLASVRNTSVAIDTDMSEVDVDTSKGVTSNNNIVLKFFVSLISLHELQVLCIVAFQSSSLSQFATPAQLAGLQGLLPNAKSFMGGGSSLNVNETSRLIVHWGGRAADRNRTATDRCAVAHGGTSTSACTWNASCVFLGPVVVNQSTIHVSDVRFEMPTATPLPSSVALLASNAPSSFSVFAVVVQSSSKIALGSLILVRNITMDAIHAVGLLQQPPLFVVPFQISGVAGYVSSAVTIQDDSMFAVVDCTINRRSNSLNIVAVLVEGVWPNKNGSSALTVKDRAMIVLQSTSILASAKSSLRFFGSRPKIFVGTWFDAALLVLGCNNKVNGASFPGPLTPWSILEGVPLRARAIFLPNNGTNDRTTGFLAGQCSTPLHLGELYSKSMTTTTSASNAIPDPIAPIALPAISPNTVLLALAAFDGVTLIALGQSACGSPQLKKATSDTRYLLSPFFDYGGESSVLGNIGVVIVFGVLHWFGAFILTKMAKPAPVPVNGELSTKEELFTFSTNKRKTTNTISSRGAWWPSPGAVKAHFPNVSIQVLVFFLNGTAFCATNVVTLGSTIAWHEDDARVLSIISGVVGLLCVLAPCFLFVAFVEVNSRANSKTATKRAGSCSKPGNNVLGNFRFGQYSHAIRYSSQLVPAFALPLGRWEPMEMRSTLGVLRGLVQGNQGRKRYSHNTRCAMLPVALAVVTHALLGVQGPAEWWCPVQWTALCAITLSCALVFALLKPARIPLTNVILGIQYLSQSLVFALSAIVQNTESARAVTALMGISTLSTVLAIVKLAHSAVVMLWERDRAAAAALSTPTLQVASTTVSMMPDSRKRIESGVEKLFLRAASNHLASSDIRSEDCSEHHSAANHDTDVKTIEASTTTLSICRLLGDDNYNGIQLPLSRRASTASVKLHERRRCMQTHAPPKTFDEQIIILDSLIRLIAADRMHQLL